MIRLTQRQIDHGVFGLITGALAVALIVRLFESSASPLTPLTAVTLVISAALWLAYWRRWAYAKHVLVIILTLIMAFGAPVDSFSRQVTHSLYVAPVLALVLTGPFWVLGSSGAILAIWLYRAGGGAYANPTELLTFAFLIGGMVFSRLAVDNVQRLEAANRAVEAERARAESERSRAEAQASELAQRNVEQQRLLDLVATLETPTIVVADGVLLAPIVGALDSRRAQMLTSRLLQDVGTQRAQHVILDIAGVMAVDTQVAQALLQSAQALRLLGCAVTLTGISPTVATTLTHLGIALDAVATARSPQDVLASSTRAPLELAR